MIGSSYINKNLSPDEKIIVAEEVDKWLYMPIIYLLGLITLVLTFDAIFSDAPYISDNSPITYYTFAFWVIVIMICLYFSAKKTEMIVTNKRIILKKGIFIHTTNEIRLEKVESVNIKRNLGGILFGYGSIIFTGTGGKEVIFNGIPSIQEFKNKTDTIINDCKQQYVAADENEEQSSISGEIERLFQLKEKGIITEEEFNIQKAKILNS